MIKKVAVVFGGLVVRAVGGQRLGFVFWKIAVLDYWAWGYALDASRSYGALDASCIHGARCAGIPKSSVLRPFCVRLQVIEISKIISIADRGHYFLI